MSGDPGWRIAPWDETAQRELSGWRYPGRLSVYDPGAPWDPACAAAVRDPAGALVGFVVWGSEARVAGQPAVPDAVDVGLGLAPPLVHQGRGAAFAAFVLAHVEKRTADQGAVRLRCAILSWNDASLRVAQHLGFVAERTLTNDQGSFIVLSRDSGGAGS